MSFGSTEVVRGLSLDIEAATIHSLVGPNGAGKTTVANAITGHLRKYRGLIEFDGDQLRGGPWRRARMGVGRKFQVPHIFPRESALGNLNVVQKATTPTIDDWASAFGTTQAADLAHGAKQRMELEIVFALSPRLVVLDEPTAGLERPEREQLAARIRQERDEAGTTFLVVEHDLDFIAGVSDIVSYMEDGQLLASGPFSSIRENARVRAMYLGSYA